MLIPSWRLELGVYIFTHINPRILIDLHARHVWHSRIISVVQHHESVMMQTNNAIELARVVQRKDSAETCSSRSKDVKCEVN